MGDNGSVVHACRVTVAAACWLVVACGGKDDERTSDPYTGGLTAGADSGGIDTPADDPDKLDLAAGDGMDGAGDAGLGGGCEKIDFLFVIDNSGSMEDEQQNLVSSFPEFISAIRSATSVDDYNIMVIDTDECIGTFGAGETLACDTLTDPGCCDSLCATFPGGLCNTAACGCPNVADPCDLQLGAGRRVDKNGGECGIDGGGRFMVDSQTELDATFACVAEVGIDGSGNEQTLSAMSEAISPALNGAGGCNEGFLRDDALLVISIITDEEDDHEDASTGYPGFGSDGEPPQWYDAVVAAKGKESNAVVLALVGPQPPDDCPPLDKQAGGIDGAELANRILQFTSMFQFGFVGPVCASSYGPFFTEAVSVVSQACDEFTPVG